MESTSEQGTQTHVDLVAVEAAEAEGDDVAIVVTTSGGGRTRHPRRLLTAALVVVGVVGGAVALVVAVAGSGGGEGDAVRAGNLPRSSARDAPGTDAPAAQPEDRAVPPVVDDTAAPPASDIAVHDSATTPPPEPAAPQAPPAAPAGPELSATLDPPGATVAAGTSVPVTVRVTNTGDAAGSYVYDADGCEPALVPNPEIVCVQTVRVLEVPPGGDATALVTVDTTGAAAGDYTVAIGDRALLLTIV